MLPEGKKAAIYARKSKFTGKGESIDNQITLCKKRIREVYGEVSDEDIVIFQDEGFSGGNINRLEDIKKFFYAGCLQVMINGSKHNSIELAEEAMSLEPDQE